MLVGAAAKTFLLSLLAFFFFPVDRYLNRSYCGVYAFADNEDNLKTSLAMAVTSLSPERTEQDRNATGIPAIFMKQKAPQVLQLYEPSALWIAINIRKCHLLRGDRLEIRGNAEGTNRTILITAKNASLAETAWQNVPFWDNPFLVQGNTVTVEYLPSLTTLMQPLPKQARERPVVAIDSYMFAFPTVSGSSGSGVDGSEASRGTPAAGSAADIPTTVESIVGSSSEMKQAVCYKKSAPKIYEKAKAVARLLITRQNQDQLAMIHSSHEILFPTRPPRRNVEYFCTGWLVGRGNHLMTNYHCITDLPIMTSARGQVFNQQQQPTTNGQEGLSVLSLRHWLRGSSSSGSSSPSSSPGSAPSYSASSLAASGSGSLSSNGSLDGQTEATAVNFMAETKTCKESGTQGEQTGVIEATSATVVAANQELDYALLRLEPSDSSIDLARKYGYLTLRASGPVDGEAIYIPQHPNGDPKEIATTKNGRAAVIRIFSGIHTLITDSMAASSSFGSGSSSASSDNATTPVNNSVNMNVYYTADTLPGSSGSPVLSQKDNMVVALHHAGGSASISYRNGDYATGDSSSSSELNLNDYNSGIRIDLIVDDLRKQNALPPCAVAPQSCGRQSKDPCCKTKW